MNDLFPDSNAAWAALIIIVLPLLIVGAGELEERLRQRDSKFQPTVSTVRVWVVPLLTLWTLARVLLAMGEDNIFVQLLGSAVLLTGATAALTGLRVVVAELADRPRRTGRRPIPRLLLALPRLLLILATGWFLIAGVWGVDLSAALTALGVTSLVVSFALQDTLISAYRYIRSYDPRWRFSTWLYRIAIRNAGKLGTPNVVELGDLRDEENDPLLQCIKASETENLWVSARALLNDEVFAAMWLRYAEDLSVNDISAALDRSVSWTKINLMRGRQKLDAAMNETKKTSEAYG